MNELVLLQVIGLQVQVLLQLISVIGDLAMEDVFKAFKIISAADLDCLPKFCRLAHAVMRMEVFISVNFLFCMFVSEYQANVSLFMSSIPRGIHLRRFS